MSMTKDAAGDYYQDEQEQILARYLDKYPEKGVDLILELQFEESKHKMQITIAKFFAELESWFYDNTDYFMGDNDEDPREDR